MLKSTQSVRDLAINFNKLTQISLTNLLSILEELETLNDEIITAVAFYQEIPKGIAKREERRAVVNNVFVLTTKWLLIHGSLAKYNLLYDVSTLYQTRLAIESLENEYKTLLVRQ
jgi:hypothetical protein